eukprot:CAMPEP_0173398654 /NCGR_PEP_ID=MMETSP1356-20130122/42446_1 /TAXON_ID=77927 ORGANISM="Hemiselmis virescens, Strain PCC157" /NCGR_SAMPLE_ID=MMETSP1356 /ASSEMBLY_ACC=CAM_ASM_000847 /LENGTH=197 /DNA_ID=CAMNT_0014358209 /DNA_START=94 /DNA_END=688 /DNA_ORIENTATION=-
MTSEAAGGDGRNQALKEVENRSDYVVQGMERVVVDPLNHFQALCFGTALVVQYASMFDRNELVLPAVYDERGARARRNGRLVVEPVHDNVCNRTHKVLCKRLDRAVRRLQYQGRHILLRVIDQAYKVGGGPRAHRPPEDDDALRRNAQFLRHKVEGCPRVSVHPPLARVALHGAVARILDADDVNVEEIAESLQKVV